MESKGKVHGIIIDSTGTISAVQSHVPIQDFKRQYSIESTNTTPFCDCVLIGDLAEGEWERNKLATYTFSSPVWLWGPIMVLGKGELDLPDCCFRMVMEKRAAFRLKAERS